MGVRYLLVILLLSLFPSVCNGQSGERFKKLRKYFESHQPVVLESFTEIQKLGKNAEDWSFDQRGASLAFVHEDGRWHLIEKWIAIDRVTRDKMGHFFEIAPIGENQRLDVQVKRVSIDDEEFDSAVQLTYGEFNEEYRNDEAGLTVQVKGLSEKNTVLAAKFPLLFGQLFDEQPLDASVRDANVTSTKQVEFLGNSCELFEYENEAGKFRVTCCPELDFAPLKIEIFKGVENTFRDGILADVEGVVSLQKTYQYLELAKPDQESKFEIRFSTKYSDGTKAGTRIVTRFRKIDQNVGEKELEVSFPIPNGHKVFRADEPQIISQWQNGSVAMNYDKNFVSDLAKVKLVDSEASKTGSRSSFGIYVSVALVVILGLMALALHRVSRKGQTK